jgi:hypothetical protein
MEVMARLAEAVGNWYSIDTKDVTLTLSEVVGNWYPVDTIDVTLIPGEAVAGWYPVDTIDVTLIPGEAVAGWYPVDTIDVTLKPPSVSCKIDADCPSGYKCVDGKCVKEGKEFPWEWILIGGGTALVGGVVISEKAGKKKKA